MTEADLNAVLVSLKLALVSITILLFLSMPLAWWLAHTQARFKVVVEALVALPLVLPPTVLGFYLLIVLGPQGVVGQWMLALGLEPLAFTFSGLVVGSVFYSLPFVVQPLQDSFAAIGHRPLEVAATLRATPWDRFRNVVVPLARPGFITATILGFAHTIGEFGVVLMIGGNIPGATRVLSIAIYDQVETMNYANAHVLAGGLLVFSFLILLTVYMTNRQHKVIRP